MVRTPQHAQHTNTELTEPLGALSGARVVASPPVMEVIPVISVDTKSPEVQLVEVVPVMKTVAPGVC